MSAYARIDLCEYEEKKSEASRQPLTNSTRREKLPQDIFLRKFIFFINEPVSKKAKIKK
jgi:hypothetical protein